ncbi:hypothetical protein DAEQUDRAFT_767990 [Daedalea quercina L-15889]|uniref:DUF6534 domain-containing protein n=1 Tax=Daedalea quercina L-15889 TaxID=1314783 RepID=A0A165N2C4_9APHY|nr:hypothetical protein DAEQUDRAFT_767990 [Daedalea quercina L-15889]
MTSLGLTLGCVFIGTGFFSTMLYGVTCAQFTYYASHYHARDGLLLRTFVLFIWVLDTVVTIADVYILYNYSVDGHGVLTSLEVLPKMFSVEYATVGIAIFIVQMFYVHGIWHLLPNMRQRWKVACVAFPVSLSVLSAAMALESLKVIADADYNVTKTLAAAVAPTMTKIWSASIADVYVCAVLPWLLYKKKTGLVRTDNTLHKLIIYLVNRGILLALAQIAICVAYLGSKEKGMLWLIFHCLSGKVYVNSMMAVLNAREHLRSTRSRSHDVYLTAMK